MGRWDCSWYDREHPWYGNDLAAEAAVEEPSLEATLEEHAIGREENVPVMRMLGLTVEEIGQRADALAAAPRKSAAAPPPPDDIQDGRHGPARLQTEKIMNQEVINLFSPQTPAQVFDQIRKLHKEVVLASRR